MFISDKRWEGIRDQFSEEEKAQLRKAVTGETICPRGFSIDETRLDVALEFKILQAVKP